MKLKYKDKLGKTIKYFSAKESRWGYSLLLRGTKHFGYHPVGKEHIPMSKAQRLMEDKLGKKLDLPHNSMLLDAGSGEGNVAIYLAEKYGFNIRGVDLLGFAVKRAEEKSKRLNLQNKVEFHAGDYTKLNFPNKTFDGVYTMETLVHVPDYKKALSEFYRILKPGGRLALFEYSIPSRENLSPEDQQTWNMINEESGMHSLPYFIHGKMPQILKNAGFDNVVVENITPHVLPMLRKFYLIAYVPYILFKALGLQRKFINTTSPVEVYRRLKATDYWRYNVITAVKR